VQFKSLIGKPQAQVEKIKSIQRKPNCATILILIKRKRKMRQH